MISYFKYKLKNLWYWIKDYAQFTTWNIESLLDTSLVLNI